MKKNEGRDSRSMETFEYGLQLQTVVHYYLDAQLGKGEVSAACICCIHQSSSLNFLELLGVNFAGERCPLGPAQSCFYGWGHGYRGEESRDLATLGPPNGPLAVGSGGYCTL